jgi:hypothetical protein
LVTDDSLIHAVSVIRRALTTEPITVMLDWAAGLMSVPPPQPPARRATELARGSMR